MSPVGSARVERHGDAPDAKSTVNSVLRACRVLELLAQHGPELGLSAVAERSGLTRPTAHRLLRTLQHSGWVRRTPAGGYALTMRVFSVGSAAASGVTLREVAQPVIAELAQQTGDTAYLLVPNDGAALCVDRIEGPHPVRVHRVNVGDSISMLSGAAPVAMTAAQPDLLTTAIDRRSAAAPAMRARLEQALRDGHVVSPDDVLGGVTAIGAAVFDLDGRVVGGVSVTGVNDRYVGPHRAAAVDRVVAAAAAISRQLGHRVD